MSEVSLLVLSYMAFAIWLAQSALMAKSEIMPEILQSTLSQIEHEIFPFVDNPCDYVIMSNVVRNANLDFELLTSAKLVLTKQNYGLSLLYSTFISKHSFFITDTDFATFFYLNSNCIILIAEDTHDRRNWKLYETLLEKMSQSVLVFLSSKPFASLCSEHSWNIAKTSFHLEIAEKGLDWKPQDRLRVSVCCHHGNKKSDTLNSEATNVFRHEKSTWLVSSPFMSKCQHPLQGRDVNVTYFLSPPHVRR